MGYPAPDRVTRQIATWGIGLLALFLGSLINASAQNNSGSITGQVFLRRDTPAPNVRVKVINLGNKNKRGGRTNGNGQFVITHLPPGNYQILAYGGNSSGGVFKFFVSLTRENVVYPPPIVLGEPMYRAQVIDSAGKGIQNAKVTLTNESSRDARQQFRTKADSTTCLFSLPALTRSSYPRQVIAT